MPPVPPAGSHTQGSMKCVIGSQSYVLLGIRSSKGCFALQPVAALQAKGDRR